MSTEILTSLKGRLLGLGKDRQLIGRRDSDGSDAVLARPIKIVNVTATATLTAKDHSQALITVNAAAGLTLTLPAATGTGDRYKIFIGTTVTSNSVVIQVANGTDEFLGSILNVDTDTSDALAAWPAIDADGYDTITLNGSTTGGIKGDWIEITDMASGVFLLEGKTTGTGVVATPLSAAV